MKNLMQSELQRVVGGAEENAYVKVVYTTSSVNGTKVTRNMFTFDRNINMDEQRAVYNNMIKDLVKQINSQQPNYEVYLQTVNV